MTEERRFGFVCPREGPSPPGASQLLPYLCEWRRHQVEWLQPECGAASLFNTTVNDQTIPVPHPKLPDDVLPLLGLLPPSLILNPCNAIDFSGANLKDTHMGDR